MKNMTSTHHKTNKPMVIGWLELHKASRGAVDLAFRCGAWRKGPRKGQEQARRAIKEQI